MLYIDGASRGNPGEAGIGILIKDFHGERILTVSKYIGVTTNNRAEYTALLEGLKAVSGLSTVNPGMKRFGLKVFSDSELLVRQLKGQYKVRDTNLKELYQKVSVLLKEFKDPEIIHISRDYNKEADRLANEAIDSAKSCRVDTSRNDQAGINMKKDTK